MARVRFAETVVLAGRIHLAGENADLTDREADRLVSRGLAALIDPPDPGAAPQGGQVSVETNDASGNTEETSTPEDPDDETEGQEEDNLALLLPELADVGKAAKIKDDVLMDLAAMGLDSEDALRQVEDATLLNAGLSKAALARLRKALG